MANCNASLEEPPICCAGGSGGTFLYGDRALPSSWPAALNATIYAFALIYFFLGVVRSLSLPNPKTAWARPRRGFRARRLGEELWRRSFRPVSPLRLARLASLSLSCAQSLECERTTALLARVSTGDGC